MLPAVLRDLAKVDARLSDADVWQPIAELLKRYGGVSSTRSTSRSGG
jgi:hypothetical protein